MAIQSGIWPLIIEKNNQLFGACIQKGIDIALDAIRQKYEDPLKIDDLLPYHNSYHARDVMRRVMIILAAIRKTDPSLVTDRDIQLCRLAAAFHCTVQKSRFEFNRGEDWLTIKRKKMADENSRESADRAINFMIEANTQALKDVGGPVFSREDMLIVKEGIETIVGEINPNQKPSVLFGALVLADQGTAAIDGPELFLKECDAIFREDNVDFYGAVLKLPILSKSTREELRERVIEWMKSRIEFVLSFRRTIFDIRPYHNERDLIIFRQCSASANALESKLDERRSMTFEQLIRDMGYDPNGIQISYLAQFMQNISYPSS